MNSRAKGARSGFKGVEYAPKNKENKYRGVVHLEGKSISAGSYQTAVEAALARDRKAREVEGEYAYLNFPDGTGRSAQPIGRRGKTVLKNPSLEPADPGLRKDRQAQ